MVEEEEGRGMERMRGRRRKEGEEKEEEGEEKAEEGEENGLRRTRRRKKNS